MKKQCHAQGQLRKGCVCWHSLQTKYITWWWQVEVSRLDEFMNEFVRTFNFFSFILIREFEFDIFAHFVDFLFCLFTSARVRSYWEYTSCELITESTSCSEKLKEGKNWTRARALFSVFWKTRKIKMEKNCVEYFKKNSLYSST